MTVVRASLLAASLAFAGLQAQAPPPAKAAKPKAFEISNGNLYEALRQMAAYEQLDLVIDPDVPNRKGLYAFKHTTWEKALDSIASSHGLGWEIRDGILHVSLASRAQGDLGRAPSERTHASRTIAITYRPSSDGEPLLSVNVSKATRAEILEALTKLERVAKAKPGTRAFTANWVLRPLKEGAREDLETFTMEDITPTGLRALYP